MRFCSKPAMNSVIWTLVLSSCVISLLCDLIDVDVSILDGFGLNTIVKSFCRHEIEVPIGHDFYFTTIC